MKSASDGDVFQSAPQMFHAHVFLAAPLGSGYIAEPSTDQHEGRIAIQKTAPGAAADFPVEPVL